MNMLTAQFTILTVLKMYLASLHRNLWGGKYANLKIYPPPIVWSSAPLRPLFFLTPALKIHLYKEMLWDVFNRSDLAMTQRTIRSSQNIIFY